MENITKSDVFVENIKASHLERQEFIKTQSSLVVKKVLKTEIQARGEDIKRHDWIHY